MTLKQIFEDAKKIRESVLAANELFDQADQCIDGPWDPRREWPVPETLMGPGALDAVGAAVHLGEHAFVDTASLNGRVAGHLCIRTKHVQTFTDAKDAGIWLVKMTAHHRPALRAWLSNGARQPFAHDRNETRFLTNPGVRIRIYVHRRACSYLLTYGGLGVELGT